MKRKIIQIAVADSADRTSPVIVALCNDGTLWRYNEGYDARMPDTWSKLNSNPLTIKERADAQ